MFGPDGGTLALRNGQTNGAHCVSRFDEIQGTGQLPGHSNTTTGATSTSTVTFLLGGGVLAHSEDKFTHTKKGDLDPDDTTGRSPIRKVGGIETNKEELLPVE
jgi:hypothetical protein